ncbi:MAG: hypothetical protein AAGE52_31300 [Myxococcota bacterium]
MSDAQAWLFLGRYYPVLSFLACFFVGILPVILFRMMFNFSRTIEPGREGRPKGALYVTGPMKAHLANWPLARITIFRTGMVRFQRGDKRIEVPLSAFAGHAPLFSDTGKATWKTNALAIAQAKAADPNAWFIQALEGERMECHLGDGSGDAGETWAALQDAQGSLL